MKYDIKQSWLLNMPAYCFDFNVYKQANVNMVIRSWQHYRKVLGAISFLSHHDNVYPCAYPGNFRRILRWGGGSKPDWLKKSSDVVFFFVFCKSSTYFAEGVQWSWLFQRKLSLNHNFPIFHGEGRSNISRGPTFLRGRGPLHISI